MVNYNHPPKQSQFFDGKLYQRMLEDLQLAGMGKRTVHGYLRAVRQLADYCQRRPNKITETQLRQYFLYLKNEKQFASGSQRVAFSGIKFFYTNTVKRALEDPRQNENQRGQNAARSPHYRPSSRRHQCLPCRKNRLLPLDRLLDGSATRRSTPLASLRHPSRPWVRPYPSRQRRQRSIRATADFYA